jgi:hypothetical protein
MNLEQEATNLAHQLLLVYLLQSVAQQKPAPKQFLIELEENLINSLHSSKTIKDGSPQLASLTKARIATAIDIVRAHIP